MDNAPPLVSVIMATRNRASLVKRCIESIMTQTFPRFELVIVDDCSSDNTPRVLDISGHKYPAIRLLRNSARRGLAFCRNLAVKHSLGEFIAFIDDDDYWIDPEKLADQVALFTRHRKRPLGLVCSGVLLYRADGRIVRKEISRPSRLKAHILARNGIIYSPTVMTRKSIIQEVGGFDQSFHRGIDSDFYRRCMSLIITMSIL